VGATNISGVKLRVDILLGRDFGSVLFIVNILGRFSNSPSLKQITLNANVVSNILIGKKTN
jgi:hypothetical protein